jgi:hypothetical protein
MEHASTDTFVQAHGPIVYELPQQRIAVHPLEDRAASKLMVRRRGRLYEWVCSERTPTFDSGGGGAW